MKVWNRHNYYPATAVYVGRPTKWGNPFMLGRDGLRQEVIDRYEDWVLNAYCDVCAQDVRWFESPAGGWWIHHNHPDDDHDAVVVHYSEVLASIHELEGKDLVCWCAPLPCHADILMRIANG